MTGPGRYQPIASMSTAATTTASTSPHRATHTATSTTSRTHPRPVPVIGQPTGRATPRARTSSQTRRRQPRPRSRQTSFAAATVSGERVPVGEGARVVAACGAILDIGALLGFFATRTNSGDEEPRSHQDTATRTRDQRRRRHETASSAGAGTTVSRGRDSSSIGVVANIGGANKPSTSPKSSTCSGSIPAGFLTFSPFVMGAKYAHTYNEKSRGSDQPKRRNLPPPPPNHPTQTHTHQHDPTTTRTTTTHPQPLRQPRRQPCASTGGSTNTQRASLAAGGDVRVCRARSVVGGSRARSCVHTRALAPAPAPARAPAGGPPPPPSMHGLAIVMLVFGVAGVVLLGLVGGFWPAGWFEVASATPRTRRGSERCWTSVSGPTLRLLPPDGQRGRSARGGADDAGGGVSGAICSHGGSDGALLARLGPVAVPV